jgi:hypothetical protein
MTNNDMQEREAFEKAWQRSLDSYSGNPDSNTYGCSHKEAGWLMWQARDDFTEGCLGCDPFYNEGPDHEEHHFDACECCQRAQKLEMEQAPHADTMRLVEALRQAQSDFDTAPCCPMPHASKRLEDALAVFEKGE